MTPLTHNEFTEVLEELHENGVILGKLGTELGVSSSTLRANKSRGTTFSDVVALAKTLRHKAKLLITYNPKKHSLSFICQEAAIKQSYLASKIGISRQGLQQQQHTLSEERQRQLTAEMKHLSQTIDRLANQLEKIKD